MDEAVKRDAGMKRAADSADNHYEEIRDFARNYLIKRIRPGDWVVSGQVYKAFIEAHPNMKPREKRVMGQVMKTMEREGYTRAGGQSTRDRSHKGTATEWLRTAYGASLETDGPFFGTSPRYVFRRRR